MASYGALVRMITTAEINRVQREGGYTKWAYFVDERSTKVGVIFANDTTFAAYSVDDSPDPKLSRFGLEAIADLILTPNPELLIVKAGDNEFRASVFSDPLVILEEEFTDAFSNAIAEDWQRFLHQHGVQIPRAERSNALPRLVLGIIGVLIVLFVILAIAL
jgi:hypothetical protein